jgi:hypothetical protein
MMTKRIENPPAVQSRQHKADHRGIGRDELLLVLGVCADSKWSSSDAKRADEQKLVPTGDYEWRTGIGKS